MMKSLAFFVISSLSAAQAGELREHFFSGGAEIPLEIVATSHTAKAVQVRFEGGPATMLDRIAVQLHPDQSGLPFIEEGTTVEKARYRAGLYFINTSDPRSGLNLANRYYRDPAVKFAHPIFEMPIETRSGSPLDEPLFDSQWHLKNVGQTGGKSGADLGLVPAWEKGLGNELLVAVIDLGFEADHPDLIDAWATNPGEIPGNRIDDDANGKVDDVNGWNFDLNDNRILYGASNSHGTATAGIMGARANGIGTSGVCPECRILPLVVYTDVEQAVEAFYYAKERGARVISNSWGYQIGMPRTDLLEQTLSDVANSGTGVSILFAMPNSGYDVCRGRTPDISAHADVIAVSSIDHLDNKVANSGYGECLDFVGPTSSNKSNAIATTDRVGERGYNRSDSAESDFDDLDYTKTFHGTSAATPAVAGVFALAHAFQPNLSRQEIFKWIKETADKPNPGSAGYDANGHSSTYGFGRPNAGAALQALESASQRQ